MLIGSVIQPEQGGVSEGICLEGHHPTIANGERYSVTGEREGAERWKEAAERVIMTRRCPRHSSELATMPPYEQRKRLAAYKQSSQRVKREGVQRRLAVEQRAICSGRVLIGCEIQPEQASKGERGDRESEGSSLEGHDDPYGHALWLGVDRE